MVTPAMLLLALLVVQETVPKFEPGPAAPLGKVSEGTSAEDRPYWYRLPARIDPNNPPNLVLMLHGTGLDHRWSFWNYGIGNGTFRSGDIVVSPDGVTPGDGKVFNFVQGKADGDQIAGLIDLFKKRYAIGHVYLYGHSQGAFFSYWFAGEYPTHVNGIVAHAGNVLEVKHPPYAVEHVAIGILHGRADAVVPVECAVRTEKIYRERGYKKLRLSIVEGLTQQSGHWPLPREVGTMIEWLDDVCVDTAPGLLELAIAELAKEAPDLAVLSGALSKAGERIKVHKGPDRKALESRLVELGALLEDLGAAHAEAIVRDPGSARFAVQYGPWAAHFRRVNRPLRAVKSWSVGVKSQLAAAKPHEEAIERARAALAQPGKKVVAEATKVAERSYLADGYEDLMALLAAAAEGDAKWSALAAARRESDDQGRATAAKITSERAAAFRQKHSDWFPPSER